MAKSTTPAEAMEVDDPAPPSTEAAAADTVVAPAETEDPEKDDDGSVAEEEYEIEAILEAQARAKGGGYEYLVSWVGYGPEHNSWVIETDFGSNELIDEWWQKQPGGRPTKGSKGRKSVAGTSSTPVTNKKKGGRGAAGDDESPNKSGRKSKSRGGATTTAGGGDDMEEDEQEFSRVHKDSMAAYADLADWEEQVKSIETIERGQNQRLVVYMIMVGGEKTAQDSETVYTRCPRKMLKFYEGHLKWRTVDANK